MPNCKIFVLAVTAKTRTSMKQTEAKLTSAILLATYIITISITQ